ncbi:MAG: hypothetical protein HYU83_02260 [Chloroflexi bacterium]|nr:hypothetical protein [Chloroflexota bacterium]
MPEKTPDPEMNNAAKDERLATQLSASLIDGHLPCATAFQIAGKLGVSRRQVGDMANQQKVRIIDCQLGCFKFEKAVHNLDSIRISQALADDIKAALIDGSLPCTVTFEVAKKAKAAPREVADVANKLKIKINHCQLGCFP